MKSSGAAPEGLTAESCYGQYSQFILKFYSCGAEKRVVSISRRGSPFEALQSRIDPFTVRRSPARRHSSVG
jgi:hypothetical protein